MLLVADTIKDSRLTVSPETLLTEIVRLTEKLKEKNTVAQELLVVDNSQFLGVFKLFDLIGLISSGSNLEQIKVAEVMESAITLQPDDDFQKALFLMTKHDVKFLPVINQAGEVVEIVTLEEVAANLQTELLKTKEKLNEKVKQCDDLKVKFDNLASTNKLLQNKICDSLATEAQLLQTTSELQELFQAFPDIYFRLNTDATILSCHTKEFSDLYLPPEQFLGKRIQEILPPDTSEQFQIAISLVIETNLLTAIEYSLSVSSGEKSFEARLQTTIGNHIIVIVRDITERKQAEIELQNAKDELEIRVEQRTCELKNINSRLRQEIIERQRIEEELRFRVDFEKLITNISNDFINITANETDNGINQALKTIGEFAGVDRSYVFLLSENLEKINNTHEWCASEITSRIDDLQNIYVEDVTLFVEKLRCGETLELQNIRDLLLQETVEEQVFNTQDINSLIILPIVCSGDLIGFLGFESFKVITWTENSIVLLKIVAETLGNVLGRKRVEQALRVSEER